MICGWTNWLYFSVDRNSWVRVHIDLLWTDRQTDKLPGVLVKSLSRLNRIAWSLSLMLDKTHNVILKIVWLINNTFLFYLLFMVSKELSIVWKIFCPRLGLRLCKMGQMHWRRGEGGGQSGEAGPGNAVLCTNCSCSLVTTSIGS